MIHWAKVIGIDTQFLHLTQKEQMFFLWLGTIKKIAAMCMRKSQCECTAYFDNAPLQPSVVLFSGRSPAVDIGGCRIMTTAI